jgi:hypothetical protein
VREKRLGIFDKNLGPQSRRLYALRAAELEELPFRVRDSLDSIWCKHRISPELANDIAVSYRDAHIDRHHCLTVDEGEVEMAGRAMCADRSGVSLVHALELSRAGEQGCIALCDAVES